MSLKINRLKLNDELSEQAARFASAAEVCERLHDALSKIKLRIQFKSDDFTKSMRDKYRNVNPKIRPTETALKAMFGADPEIKALKEEYLEKASAFRMAKIQVDALKMRAEMMVSMAHNIRQERKSSDKTKV